MREIEFRGFDLDEKKWFYGGYFKHIKRQVSPLGDELKEEDIQHIIFINGLADWNMPIPIKIVTKIDKKSIGQYTGRIDKNGKKIFGKDIVKLKGYLWEVYWNDEECCFKMKNKFDDLFLTKFKEKAIEVIGNIYENPELLGEKND